MKINRSWLDRKTLLMFGVIFVSGMMFFFACNVFGRWVYSALDCPSGKPDPQNLDALTRSKLPTSIGKLDSYQIGGPYKYCHIHVYFEIDPSELNAFLNSTRINQALASKGNLHLLYWFPDVVPWKPFKPIMYQFGRGPVSLDYTQTIVVDAGDPNLYVVMMIIEYESI
jgi:hypothetical protein